MQTTTTITIPLTQSDMEFLCGYFLGKTHNKEIEKDERHAAAEHHLTLYKKLDRDGKETVRALADQMENPKALLDTIIKQLREAREKLK